ncbi:DNRLRE domain-containing protein [Aeoliella sp.]|uniref:DNRLRE domain-containing protein n=1 Tax=Aeoliella sp. TaxID=2795800 RepID=UPI003CCC3E21
MSRAITVSLLLLALSYSTSWASNEVSLLATQDAHILDGGSTYPTLSSQNYGSFPYLNANFSDDTRSIGLLQFDISLIPSKATIVSSQLKLFHSRNDALDKQYDLYEVTSSWDESTVTFNTGPSINPTAAASLTIPDKTSGTYRSWDVTQLVDKWVDGTDSNFGIWLEENPTPGDGPAYFTSSDWLDSSQHPILTIEYSVVPEPSSIIICSLMCLSVRGVMSCQHR